VTKAIGFSLLALLVASLAQAESVGAVFYISLENHNWTQRASLTSPHPIYRNPAAPFINSLVSPGNPNAANVSYASKYLNVVKVPCDQQLDWVHPSEPNYVWMEAGLAKLTVPLNRRDDPPFPNNIVTAQHLSQLLQEKGLAWRSYQEDIDLAKDLMGQVTDKALPASEWTVPLISFFGASPAYSNRYNASHQYNYQPKHNPPLFFEDTNGGNDAARNNPMAKNYAPLQQLESDLTNNTVARYNWITPNIHNDMHSSLKTDFAYNGVTYAAGTDEQQIALGDNFLSKIVPLIESSQAVRNNGLIVIWTDETEGSPGCGSVEFTLAEIVISPLARGNAYANSIAYSHSSDLRTPAGDFWRRQPGRLSRRRGQCDLIDRSVQARRDPSVVAERYTLVYSLV
jgi:hypothetical protein